jgi:hypothetical protein
MSTSSQRQVIWTSLGIGGRGPGSRRHRGLIIAVGVVVLLIAVIALANRSSQSKNAADDLLAPEISHSREGAQSAAAKMASALGSETMFNPDDRHGLLQIIAEPDRRNQVIQDYDAEYTAAFNKTIGLDSQGRPPAGATFVSRTMPAGTTVRSYAGSTADVSVWCSTLFGLTGETAAKKIPLTTGWLTMTMTLRWTEDGWKLADFQQTDGPKPTDAGAKFGTVPQL